MIEFEIAGEPKPKGRPRMTKTGHTYTPKETRQTEVAVQLAWELSGGQRLNGPLVFECDFYMGTKRRVDVDNLAKLCLDALNGKAFEDDSQIVKLVARKIFTSKDDARTVVKVWQMMETVYER